MRTQVKLFAVGQHVSLEDEIDVICRQRPVKMSTYHIVGSFIFYVI